MAHDHTEPTPPQDLSQSTPDYNHPADMNSYAYPHHHHHISPVSEPYRQSTIQHAIAYGPVSLSPLGAGIETSYSPLQPHPSHSMHNHGPLASPPPLPTYYSTSQPFNHNPVLPRMPIPPYPLDDHMMSGGRHRTREIKRRTRTGCLTCRERRIKCDELHPVCRNCIKSKRDCKGYDPTPKRQSGQQKNQITKSPASLSPVTTDDPLSNPISSPDIASTVAAPIRPYSTALRDSYIPYDPTTAVTQPAEPSGIPFPPALSASHSYQHQYQRRQGATPATSWDDKRQNTSEREQNWKDERPI